MKPLLIAAMILSLQTPEALSEGHVLVDLRGGACAIFDCKDNRHGPGGFNIWLGGGAAVLCSFRAIRCDLADDLNIIDASGSAINRAGRPVHFSRYTGFYNSDGDLIACGGGNIAGKPPIEDAPQIDVMFLPIPQGVYNTVASYKSAYYESNAEIGLLASDNDISDVTTPSNPPEHRNDSVIDSNPDLVRQVAVHSGVRRILEDHWKGWRVETSQGKIDPLKPTPSFEERSRQDKIAYPLKVTDTLDVHVRCSFTIGNGNAIVPEIKFVNSSKNTRHNQLYLSLYDRAGNLICCTEWQVTSEAGEKYYSTVTPMPIPKGFENHVAEYKITVYESGNRIGEVEKISD